MKQAIEFTGIGGIYMISSTIDWPGENPLEDIRKAVDAQVVTVVSLREPTQDRLGLDMWLDDEGLYSSDSPQIWNMVFGNDVITPVAGGHFLILGVDMDGNSHGLSNAEATAAMLLTQFIPFGGVLPKFGE